MPRLTQSVPKYRKHKASGQAIVTLDGQDFYLGPYDSRPSWREYDRLVGEWQQNGRRLPQVGQHSTLTMAELMNAYRKFAAGYYVKHGQPTDTIYGIKAMLKLVRASYTHTRVLDFGPLALKALQSQMIEAGSSRRYINDHLHRDRDFSPRQQDPVARPRTATSCNMLALDSARLPWRKARNRSGWRKTLHQP